MECTENYICGTNKNIKVFQYILAYGGKNFIKLILIYLYCNKYNEINIFQSIVQKHHSYTESQNDFCCIMGYASKHLKMYFKDCFCHTKF